MKQPSHRSLRAGEFIARELCVLLSQSVRDPRVQNVRVMEVRVAPDFSHARVFVTFESDKPKEVLEGLRKAAGFLRSQLAEKMNTRTVPALMFVIDHSYEKAARIEQLLKDATKHISDDPQQ